MPPEPTLDPNEGERGNTNEAATDPELQREAEKQASDAIKNMIDDKKKLTYEKAIINLMKTMKISMEALSNDINKVFKNDPNSAKLVSEWFSDVFSSSGNFKKLTNFFKDPKNQPPDALIDETTPQAEAVKKYAKIKGKSMMKVMEGSIKDLTKKIQKAGFKMAEGDSPANMLADFMKLHGDLKDIDKFTEEHVTPDAEKTFKDNLLKKYINDIKSGKIGEVEKPSFTDSLKKSLKWLVLLLLMGGSLILFAKFLIAYSESHSGCQLISAKVNEMPVSTPYKCWANGGPGSDINVLNPGNSITNYNSAQCICGKSSKVESGCEISCSNTACSGSNAENCATPHPMDCGAPECRGKKFTTPYSFYYWGIMTPIDSLGNMGNGIVNGAHNALKWLIDLIIKFAIAIGVLIVLGIIYFVLKMVLSKKSVTSAPSAPSATSAPSTVKFGNRGYLGNLSKYSNYGYMGRCAALPARPYIPVRYR